MAPAQDKTLAVLSAFSIERPCLTLSDIARVTGIPLSTTHRLVERLTSWGALERDERGQYVIGPRMWEVGTLSPHSYHQRVRVVPLLERLFVATGEQTVLSTFHPRGGVTVEQVLGWRDAEFFAGVGERLPLHATSPGIVLLAFGEPQLWTVVTQQPLRRYTTNTIADIPRLRRAVLETRRTGLALSEGAYIAHTSSMSSPVFGYRGALYGAVSVVWTSGMRDAASLAPPLVETASAISAGLRTSADESLPHPVRRAAFGHPRQEARTARRGGID